MFFKGDGTLQFKPSMATYTFTDYKVFVRAMKEDDNSELINEDFMV